MKNITPATIAAASNECQVENEFTLSMWTDDPYNILEEELLSISKNTALNQENLSLRQKFENLAHTQRQPFATNILDYWKNHSTIDGDIQNAVKTNLSIPIGLAEIERAQTAVTTVLTKQKSNISAYNLKSIILVKLNGSILSDIEV